MLRAWAYAVISRCTQQIVETAGFCLMSAFQRCCDNVSASEQFGRAWHSTHEQYAHGHADRTPHRSGNCAAVLRTRNEYGDARIDDQARVPHI